MKTTRLKLMSRQFSDKQFIGELVGCQRELYAYVLSLVPHVPDAQDVLQETAIALWDKIDEFDPEKPFLPWALRFAYFQALKHRTYRKRRGAAALSEEAMQRLADDGRQLARESAARAEALDRCIEKLNDTDRELLRQRYAGELTIKEIAARSQLRVGRLYKNLGRIRRLLLDCVTRTLAETGAT